MLQPAPPGQPIRCRAGRRAGPTARPPKRRGGAGADRSRRRCAPQSAGPTADDRGPQGTSGSAALRGKHRR